MPQNSSLCVPPHPPFGRWCGHFSVAAPRAGAKPETGPKPEGADGMNIEQDMRRICTEATRLGLHPATTAHLLKQYGAVGAARRLLALPDRYGPDLTHLASRGRLDLAVEAVALRNPQHFHEGELVAALRRLCRYGYSVERYASKVPPGR